MSMPPGKPFNSALSRRRVVPHGEDKCVRVLAVSVRGASSSFLPNGLETVNAPCTADLRCNENVVLWNRWVQVSCYPWIFGQV